MTIEEVVRKVLLDEHADVIREAVKAVVAELMELEVSELIGADSYSTTITVAPEPNVALIRQFDSPPPRVRVPPVPH